jgi:hypothetical protein
MIVPTRYQLDLLGEAVKYLKEEDYAPYLKLKHLLAEKPSGFRLEFRRTFESYYVMGAAGLTEDFKNRFFELLFALAIRDDDPYTSLLKDLYEYPRRQGDKSLQCSFVSKLVAVHDESRPILDKHVSNFFGIKIPSTGGVDFKISVFVACIGLLRKIYQGWAEDSQFNEILSRLKLRHPRLVNCDTCRVADLLVWTVGREALWDSPAMSRGNKK